MFKEFINLLSERNKLIMIYLSMYNLCLGWSDYKCLVGRGWVLRFYERLNINGIFENVNDFI